VCARRPISRRFGRASGRYFCKRSAVLVEPGILACKRLPAKHCDIDVGRIDFDREAGTPRNLGRDYGGARAAEWLVHGLPR
jgi:hypothetical protein